MRKEIMNYEAPLIEVMDVEVEKGFAASDAQIGTNSWETGTIEGGYTVE